MADIASRLTLADLEAATERVVKRHRRVLLQPLFRDVMFTERLGRAATMRGTPVNDPSRRFTHQETYRVVDMLLPLCGRVYKKPHDQCREEMQRWERNRLTTTGEFGAGEFYWSDVTPPGNYGAVPAQGRKWSRRNHVLSNSRRKPGDEGPIIR